MTDRAIRTGWLRRLPSPSFLALAVAFFVPTASAAQAGTVEDPVGVARALVEAFNRHDPGAMADLVSEDFELYYVGDDGEAVLSSRGADQLRRDMEAYFSERPGVQSEVESVVPGTRFVAFRERIVGGASSLAVYEVMAGRLRRAWYFPAEKDAPGPTP